MNKLLLLIIVFPAIVFSENFYRFGDELIYRSCISESGNSIYDLSLNLDARVGEIRYRYFGQDIFYDAQITKLDETIIKGIASFKDSRSGEIKGTSWIFTFYRKQEKLTDNDNTAAGCK